MTTQDSNRPCKTQTGQQKIELSRDVTFEQDVAYRRSRRTDSNSDDLQELLVSPSPPAEKEIMEDDIVEPTDLVDRLMRVDCSPHSL